jgi:hypothetical protein
VRHFESARPRTAPPIHSKFRQESDLFANFARPFPEYEVRNGNTNANQTGVEQRFFAACT